MLNEFLNLFRSFDAEGYDSKGFNRRGFNKEGRYRNGGLYDSHGFDVDGYDSKGFNDEGYDREGYGRNGYDKEGYDRGGYDRKGYDRDGYDRKGYDRDGYDRKGYDKGGYDRDGYSAEGYDREGYDREGYDCDGFDPRGFDRGGFNRSGRRRDGKIWWLTSCEDVPISWSEVITEPTDHSYASDRVCCNPIELLGLARLEGPAEVRRRAKELERLAEVGISQVSKTVNPYCRCASDFLTIKKAAETLLNQKEAGAARFFWLDFDESDALEAQLAQLVASKRLHAAYHLVRGKRNPRGCRLGLLIALLILEQEGTCDAASAVANRWSALRGQEEYLTCYGLEQLPVDKLLAELMCEVAESGGGWDIAREFGKATGTYGTKFHETVVAPAAEAVRRCEKSVERATAVMKESGRAGGNEKEQLEDLKKSVLQARNSVVQLSREVPDSFLPMRDAVDGFAHSVREAAVAVVNAGEQPSDSRIRMSRELLVIAEQYAKSVSLRHRIANDKSDLDRIVADWNYVRKLDALINKALEAAKANQHSDAREALGRARDLARTPEERKQVDILCNTVEKQILVGEFKAYLDKGMLDKALETIDRVIQIEEDYSERFQLRLAREKLVNQIELIRLRTRNGYPW